jgi:hypothetical protein
MQPGGVLGVDEPAGARGDEMKSNAVAVAAVCRQAPGRCELCAAIAGATNGETGEYRV